MSLWTDLEKLNNVLEGRMDEARKNINERSKWLGEKETSVLREIKIIHKQLSKIMRREEKREWCMERGFESFRYVNEKDINHGSN